MAKKQIKVKEEIEDTKNTEEIKSTEKFDVLLTGQRVVSDENDASRNLYDQSRFGEIKDGKIQYSLVEVLFLYEKGKINIRNDKGKELNLDSFVKLATKFEPNFWKRFCVYRDLRSRGYIVKTALKFGADFRVYDRGVKPGEDHAKWIVYPVHETETLTWYEFSAKNRVAHSTRKKLMLGIVDDENDVTYYVVSWMRP